MTETVSLEEDQKYPLPSLEDLYESDSINVTFFVIAIWHEKELAHETDSTVSFYHPT